MRILRHSSAAKYLVGGCRAISLSATVDSWTGTRALAAAERRRAEAAGLRAHLVVEGQQVGGHAPHDSAARPGGLGLGLADLGEARIAARGDRGDVGPDRCRLAVRAVAQRLGRLAPLHQVEHDLFKVGLPTAERGDLRLQRLKLAGVRHAAGVELLVVPVDADPYLFDVLFRAGELTVQVGEVRVRDRDRVPDLRRPLIELAELGEFGRVRRR